MIVTFPFIVLVFLIKFQPDGRLWWDSLSIAYSICLILASLLGLYFKEFRKGIMHNVNKSKHIEYWIIPQIIMLVIMSGIVTWVLTITHPSVGILMLTSVLLVYLLQIEIHRNLRNIN